MASSTGTGEIEFPSLPADHDGFIKYLAENPQSSVLDLVEPYKHYDAELRKVFAQQPDHPAAKQPNVVPVFTGQEEDVKIRARNLDSESKEEKECYIMPLKDEDRRPDGASAIVQSLDNFRTNFNVFSESSLVDLDWSNVVVAGSAVATCLLAVPERVGSKRDLRQYYHEKLAPASDVDLFLYGLNEEQAIDKIKQIESNVRDALLVETTTIRTKNTVTIASRHPVRHVQIVLRIYKSISEILTGFDVDCSCAAYDGDQVYVKPRALAAYMTQINTVDLTRRSPSYENRLSKYAHRGFEIYWPSLDRSRIDPTIFERSFGRTQGLARLLVLEKLPKSQDREAYLDQRRAERGRPAVNRQMMRRRLIPGNIKNDFEDEVAEWADEEFSDYHSIAIPYGPKYHARKIEKLLYTKDLLLNAEWNQPKDREVNLHRHPAFFGTVVDVIQDCCGYCPAPATVEEEEIAEDESRTYISGHLKFVKDDPGRQAIGSFHPLTSDDWTAMAYVGNTALLCQAIVDEDIEYVQTWLNHEGNDPNTRDYTGRTPLHLAVANSTPEVVQALIDHGARLIARLVDGKTALHLAAMRGSVEMVSMLLRKSEANKEEEEKRVDARRAARKAAKEGTTEDVSMQDADKAPSASAGGDNESDVDMIETADLDKDENMDATTENSIVNIKLSGHRDDEQALANGEREEEPDIYMIDVVAWDVAVSPLHLAIAKGHVDVVRCLVQDFGADILLPIKLFNGHDKSARAAILTLVLALQLPMDQAGKMARTLIELGASSAQASIDQTTALQSYVGERPDLLDTLADTDGTGVARAINHLSVSGYRWSVEVSSPLMTAIRAKDSSSALRLLALGAKPEIDFAAYMKAYQSQHDPPNDSKRNKSMFEKTTEQPILSAVRYELPLLAKNLIEGGVVDPNALTTDGYEVLNDERSRRHRKGKSLLDSVQEKLESLRQWEYNPKQPEEPIPLKEDSEYLSSYEQGSYTLWSAKKQLKAAKDEYEKDLKKYREDLEKQKDRTGVPQKQDAINRQIAEFEQLEAALVEKGAKSFKDLRPDVKEPEEHESIPRKQLTNRFANHQDHEPKPFQVSIQFKLGDLTEDSQKRYEKLFEAAWNGEPSIVKDLTLNAWKDEKGDDQAPSKAAVRDQHGLSPFSIAVLRGHLELAAAIMDIANAQHVSAEPPKSRRYEMNAGDSEDEDSDNVQLYSEIVDDEFTIENIGEVSMKVKSRVLPVDMMQWTSSAFADFANPVRDSSNQVTSTGFSYFGPRRSEAVYIERTNTGSLKKASPPASKEQDKNGIPKPNNLLRLAIYDNNSKLLSWFLDLGRLHFRAQPKQEDDSSETAFTIADQDFEYALEVGRPHLLAETIRQTGAGIPLNSLAKEYGIELKEKPKYYQGLSVYGSKRRDWVNAGRSHMVHTPAQKHRTPLLRSAYLGSLEVVEWMLSDSPMRCYNEFAEANQDDKRIQQLQLSKTGFKGSLEEFLQTRSHLAIHCCLMGKPTAEAYSLLRYLVQAMPNTVEVKSLEGFTPLQVAFELYREDSAKLLIQVGADQTCRDKSGRNILHSLLSRSFNKREHVENLKKMLDLIDKRVLPTLFVERTTRSLTPLHYYLLRSGRDHCKERVFRTLLEYGAGQDLSLISGEGDTPLHNLVKTSEISLIEIILEREPSLMNRENATGRTPYEMAEDGALAEACNDPPPMPDSSDFKIRRARRYGLKDDWATDVLDCSPKSFVEEAKIAELSRRERVWKLLQETKAKLDAEGKSKRRLVTLNEANEVARRLAQMKSRSADYQESYNSVASYDEEEEPPKDEVQIWLNDAKRRR